MKNLIKLLVIVISLSCNSEDKKMIAENEIQKFLKEQNMNIIDSASVKKVNVRIKSKTVEGAKQAILEVTELQRRFILKHQDLNKSQKPNTIRMKPITFENEAHKNRFIDSIMSNQKYFPPKNISQINQLKKEYFIELNKILKKYEDK
jgi:Flp pilus assembly CpaF family ATPase